MRSTDNLSDLVRRDPAQGNVHLGTLVGAPRSIDGSPRQTILENSFPFRELSLVIGADRRVRDPLYGIHRWWARRPPALLRGLLIASHLDTESSIGDFWRWFGSAERPLYGQRVFDPFAGGGSTLIEAARLGADVVGSDIDPLAVRIIKTALGPLQEELLRKAGDELLSWLSDGFGDLYPAKDSVDPLHYFYIPMVKCPNCEYSGHLYRNLILVRDPKKVGAVVRAHGISCFCPTCFSIRHIKSSSAVRLRCCGRYRSIWSGTFQNHYYRCPACGTKSSHRELQTGVAEQRLIAVEESPLDGPRHLREPTSEDIQALQRAQECLASRRSQLPLPAGDIEVGHHDDRPISYGITRYDELFTARQLLTFSSAWKWMSEQDLADPVKQALELAVSNALATNNRLCGYATDYGRLSALFSVRGYSLPALSVELNPLHATGGRGTIAACIARLIRAARSTNTRRYTWNQKKRRVVPSDIELTTAGIRADVRCCSADSIPDDEPYTGIGLCIMDPPYYDYIAYDELSAFYRAWHPDWNLAGTPLLPGKGARSESFGSYLGRCMKFVVSRILPGSPITFTYHSANQDAWRAIGEAIDEAELRITAIWPVKSDGHMGHHSNEGNIEWDLVFVCRRRDETEPRKLACSVEQWIADVRPLKVSNADKKSMGLALCMAASRFARLRSMGSMVNAKDH